MPDLLLVADSLGSPDLRHELPVAFPDPCVLLVRDGVRHVVISSFEVSRLEHLPRIRVHPLEDADLDELRWRGLPEHEFWRELALNAAHLLRVTAAATPEDFPLGIADHLRAHGIELRPDGALFESRRRVKTEAELAGILRAQRAAEKAMEAVGERLRGGGRVTCEELREAAVRVFGDEGMTPPDIVIVSHGPQTAIGHEPGSGEILAGEPVVVDLFPQDPVSGCYADMTRTFCLGEPPAELLEFHRLCSDALAQALAAIRPGATGAEVYGTACDVFEAAGQPTRRTKTEGEVLDSGFFHALGHGVGLAVHEPPFLERGGPELVAGDVFAVEPGCYRPGFGGCRIEELVLVTEDGCELLTDFPYDLAP